MTRRQIFIGTAGIAGLLFALWLAGLVLFVARVTSYAEQPLAENLQKTDAIVVLTGGSERLQAGLDLLQAGKGAKLLISGVHQGVSADKVLETRTISDDLRSCCIALGYAADNTLGNAAETNAFMKAENFHSLRLVTAHYHMPRSLLFFSRMMPDMEIVPFPVSPDIVSLSDWWTRLGTASLLIGEYNKYLYAWFSVVLGVHNAYR